MEVTHAILQELENSLTILGERKEQLKGISKFRKPEEEDVSCEPLELSENMSPEMCEITTIFQSLLTNGAKRINEMAVFLGYQERKELMKEYRCRIGTHYTHIKDLVQNKEKQASPSSFAPNQTQILQQW